MIKTITLKQFEAMEPCWLDSAQGRARLSAIAAARENWTALDILALEGVSAADRLWAALREELIDAPILHEFACWCAEQALALIPAPDPRSVAAIAAKRALLRGDIDDAALAAARDAAWDAARDAAWDAARDAQIDMLREMLVDRGRAQ